MITRFEILDHYILIQGNISKSTPTKSTPVKEQLLGIPEGSYRGCLICFKFVKIKKQRFKSQLNVINLCSVL